jgi:hypothetical protein
MWWKGTWVGRGRRNPHISYLVQKSLDKNTWFKAFYIGQHQILLIFIISRNKTAYFIRYSLEVTCSCRYFVSLGWRYSDQQMRFNKYFLYEYVNWLSIASKTWHITPRTLLPFHIFLLKQWSVWAFVCRHIGMLRQQYVGAVGYRHNVVSG